MSVHGRSLAALTLWMITLQLCTCYGSLLQGSDANGKMLSQSFVFFADFEAFEFINFVSLLSQGFMNLCYTLLII